MRPQISLLVPFRADDASPQRLYVWEWLKEYWGWELPDAEIVIGVSRAEVFSKTAAVNDAASRATGRIFVILDSDTYMRGSEIMAAADRIDESLRSGYPLWFIPYRSLYRLTRSTTDNIIASDPRNPLRFNTPPNPVDVESTLGSMHGRRFGAMIQIMPREAFETVGCMDPRFQGWGGEDIAFVRALDTLYGKHKTSDNDVLHLWHANIGVSHVTRMWQGQTKPRANEELAAKYNRATGDRVKMRALVDAGCEEQRRTWWQEFIQWMRDHFGVWM